MYRLGIVWHEKIMHNPCILQFIDYKEDGKVKGAFTVLLYLLQAIFLAVVRKVQ